MTKTQVRELLHTLPFSEQIELANEVLEDVGMPADFELTTELREMLEERREAYLANPHEGSSWEAVKGRILASL